MRPAFFLFWFSLSLAASASGYEVFTKGEYQGIVDENGVELVPAIYDEIGWSNGQFEMVGDLVGYRERGRWGILNLANKKITSAKYYRLEVFDEGLILAAIKGKFSNHLFYGLVDRKGQVRISCNYFSIKPLNDGYVATTYEEGKLKQGYFNSQFNQIVVPSYQKIDAVNDYLLVAESFDGKWSFIEGKGRQTINESFEGYKAIDDGVVVRLNGKYGMLSADATRWKLDPIYKSINDEKDVIEFPTWDIKTTDLQSVFSVEADSIGYDNQMFITSLNGMQEVIVDGVEIFGDQKVRLKAAQAGFLVAENIDTREWSLVTTSGNVIAEQKDSIYYDGIYFYARSRGDWQLFNRFGRKISEKEFDGVKPSILNMIPVMKNNYWGLVDFKGEEVVQPKFDRIGLGMSSKVAVNYIGKWGCIDLFGNWVIRPEFDTLYFTSKAILGSKNGTQTIWSHDGQERLSTTAQVIDNGEYFEISSTDGVGVFSYEWETVVDPIYEQVGKVHDFYKASRNGVAVMIDSDSKFRVKPEDGVTHIYDHSQGMYMIKKDGQYGFVNQDGKLRIANRYDSLKSFSQEMSAFMLNGRWGYIDIGEALIVQPLYQHAFSFDHDLAIVMKEGKYGVIDITGKTVISAKYELITHTPGSGYILHTQDGQVGMAGIEGNVVLQPNYESIVETTNGLLLVKRSGKVGVMDQKGFTRIPFEYADIFQKDDYLIMQRLSD